MSSNETATYLDAILQHGQGEFVRGVAREPKSKGWMHAFPRWQNFLLPEIRQVRLDPVLGEVTVLQYHPPAPLCRRRDRGVGRRALQNIHPRQALVDGRGRGAGGLRDTDSDRQTDRPGLGRATA